MIVKYNLAQLPSVAKKIIDEMNEYSLFAFYGEVGAGKTTLIKEVCKQLGIKQESSSPTFSVVNEYEIKDGSTIYHIDLYRLSSLDQALEIGIDEYIYSGNTCFIEWPQSIDGLIFDEKVLCIEIENEGPDGRKFTMSEMSIEE